MQFISDFSPRPYPTHSKQRKCATTMMSGRPLLDLLGSRDPMMHCATVVLRAISRFVKPGASLQVAKRLTMMRLIGTMVPTRLSRVSPSRVTLFSVGQASDCSNHTGDTHTHIGLHFDPHSFYWLHLFHGCCVNGKIYQT